MRGKRILLIQAHPDPAPERYGRALAAAYAEGARAGGHRTDIVELAQLDFTWLRTKRAWEDGEAPEAVAQVQPLVQAADHLVFFYPLWLGDMPALLKAFLEQLLRPGFAIAKRSGGWDKRLAGKSARIVVTMGMPAVIYRWFYRAHGVNAFKRNILAFCGIAPVRISLVGMVEGGAAARTRWLARMRTLGAKAI